MKKSLHLLACALMAAPALFAAQEPLEFPGYVITGISPDGKWAASSDEMLYNFSIINLETGETWDYGSYYFTDHELGGGLGRYVSNTGVVLASEYSTDMPWYWENGEWHRLPIKDTDWGAFPNAITPDGSRIAGSVSKRAMTVEDGDVMCVPVIWERNENGTYDMYTEITHPRTDFSGRIPQYLLVDDISDDGRVLAGDLHDHSGWYDQPIVFTQAEDGTWSYKVLHPELLNTSGVEFPEFPGDAPEEVNPADFMSDDNKTEYEIALEEYNSRPYPEPMDFMTADEIMAYYEAYDAYMEDFYNNPYPQITDFMTEEEQQAYQQAQIDYYEQKSPDPNEYMTAEQKAAYDAAIVEFEETYAEWEKKNLAFYEALDEATAGCIYFQMNSSRISPNGKYFLMTAEDTEIDFDTWEFKTVNTPYLFNIEDDSYTVMTNGQSDVFATQVNDEGWVVGCSPAQDLYTRSTFIAKGPDAPFISLGEFYQDIDPDLAKWIELNKTFIVIVENMEYDEELDDYVITTTEETLNITGTSVATPDFKKVASWQFNAWDQASEFYFFSYIYESKGAESGVKEIASKASDLDIHVAPFGGIKVVGDAADVTVYDMNGRRVFNTCAPASEISTGLHSGSYIVKATGKDGKVVVKKFIF